MASTTTVPEPAEQFVRLEVQSAAEGPLLRRRLKPMLLVAGTLALFAGLVVLIVATTQASNAPASSADYHFASSDPATDMQIRLRDNLAVIAKPRGKSMPQQKEFVRGWLARELSRLGLQVWFHNYTTGASVLATLRPNVLDVTRNSQTILISAHFDSVDSTPGANDNGSGVVALIEVARLLAAQPRAYNIIVASFDEEEDGYLGSAHFVQDLVVGVKLGPDQQKINVVLMLNMDCVGYYNDQPGSQQPLVTGPESPLLQFVRQGCPAMWNHLQQNGNRADFLAVSGDKQASELMTAFVSMTSARPETMKLQPKMCTEWGPFLCVSRSDYCLFQRVGITSIAFTDTANYRSPHYHMPSDKLPTVRGDMIETLVHALHAFVAYVDTQVRF